MPGVNGWAMGLPSGLPLDVFFFFGKGFPMLETPTTVGGIAYKMISSMSGWPSLTKNDKFFFHIIEAPFQEKYCKRALPLVILLVFIFWKISRQVETFSC